ncbi:MAG TPA: hypothetical protein EYH40_02350 [Desulfurococcales archaeon]|nr:hypothetical protein [Desulfurococcales archaeon]
MTYVILVNGLLPYESGKTWTVLGLAKTLQYYRRFKVALYKPIAGHSAWYQFKTILNSLKYNVLVGEDVVKYREVLGLNYSLELINPVDFLLAPLNPKRFTNIIEYISALDNQFNQIVMIRRSDYESCLTEYFIVRENIDRIVQELKYWINKLAEKFNPESISVKDIISIAYSEKTMKILDYCLKVLCESSDIVIVESFNDAAVPYYNILEKINSVFTVTPGYIFKLNTNNFKKVVKKQYLVYGDVGLRMSNIISKVNIEHITPLPPVETVNELSSYLKEYINKILT